MDNQTDWDRLRKWFTEYQYIKTKYDRVKGTPSDFVPGIELKEIAKTIQYIRQDMGIPEDAIITFKED